MYQRAGEAVPALPHADPQRRAGHPAAAAHHLLVPGLPTGHPTGMTGDRAVRAPDRRPERAFAWGQLCSVSAGVGWAGRAGLGCGCVDRRRGRAGRDSALLDVQRRPDLVEPRGPLEVDRSRAGPRSSARRRTPWQVRPARSPPSNAARSCLGPRRGSGRWTAPPSRSSAASDLETDSCILACSSWVSSLVRSASLLLQPGRAVLDGLAGLAGGLQRRVVQLLEVLRSGLRASRAGWPASGPSARTRRPSARHRRRGPCRPGREPALACACSASTWSSWRSSCISSCRWLPITARGLLGQRLVLALRLLGGLLDLDLRVGLLVDLVAEPRRHVLPRANYGVRPWPSNAPPARVLPAAPLSDAPG